jgi:hypothetical protein
VPISQTSGTGAAFLAVTDNSDNPLLIADAAGSRTVSTGGFRGSTTDFAMVVAGSFLWSPATASAVTAKLRLSVSASTGTVNRNGNDTDSALVPRMTSTITAIEVAG